MILWALVFLSVKHTVADYVLQTGYQSSNKGIYGHPGGLLHSFIHITLTLPVFLILPPASLSLGLAIIAGEFVIHYHMDWCKEQLVKRLGLSQSNSGFWYLFGFDQLVHTITYIGIIALLIR